MTPSNTGSGAQPSSHVRAVRRSPAAEQGSAREVPPRLRSGARDQAAGQRRCV